MTPAAWLAVVKPALPYVAVVALIAAFGWYVASLRGDVREAEAARDAAHQQIGRLTHERDEALHANETLVAALQLQGAEIMRLKTEGEARATRAAQAARAAASRRFEPPAGHGPDVMNEWVMRNFP